MSPSRSSRWCGSSTSEISDSAPESLTTEDNVSCISSEVLPLHIMEKSRSFGFAGAKDKHAVTTQQIEASNK
ncbi:hypothetical protein EJB05_33082 [Eragrostis curvula]|uniref:Uncharacterized protein n=1 Tax=Eragrostis curvula TaxID=38414 RepID=A0A5J9U1N2_9POAL|nr:hypothetical protein EJB05_33082 [Eragrostis curvula]